jgi:hypothetical protein
MSGWTPEKQGHGLWAAKAYDAETIKAGIRKTRAGRSRMTTQGIVSTFAIQDRTAAGVIFESAGTKSKGERGNSSNPHRGSRSAGSIFIRNIEERSGIKRPMHRMIVLALIQDRPKIVKAIKEAIDEAVTAVNRRAA